LNLTAQVVDPSNQTLDHLLAVTASEVLGTEVLVLDFISRHVIGGREHAGGDGKDCLFGGATCAQG